VNNQMEENSFVAIGKILTTQGNKGELKVMPLTDFPERFRQGLEVYIHSKAGFEKFKVSSSRFHNKWLILGLEGVSDLKTAESLRDCLIKITSDEVMPLPEGSYYVFQLQGLPVFTMEGRFLGNLEDVFQTGSNDVYQVMHPATNKEILIPAIKECIQTIDLENRRIMVDLLPGLVD